MRVTLRRKLRGRPYRTHYKDNWERVGMRMTEVMRNKKEFWAELFQDRLSPIQG